ncbi:MAG: serine/threonine protein phosphatase [Candidatus Rokubacteria bacterium RIFCSPHIGHO2_12_FULL_73_22]|nr:MAG: serine/threonine protein phosphatase [Candidatus Rokubacteria bacterium RIFCSPHIGHO2_12_FULL_73_22]OGL02306.1 MAG: serine/threonine protein phosphatase [Candidatus Rokubacteria bacterium RIFCSPHIGHO2_02_FULL_73_26]OGL09920.1 MAG: serine/threonine protein phosphatase [Candidatus Rokubacteria bacterium RIFCSPLOWO2_02_FULL_73_56]OGL20945.1 MAG: serine/threonine protein phosphatase [Candidatus Rokubacteria bacterium RIFCSPLOWO2_12_FULL_73_47]
MTGARTTAGATVADGPRPMKEAAGCLVVLGPFFFLSYGFANWVSAQRTDVGELVFAWERAIPFLPWTILPYWTIDAFYAASVFTCRTRAELHTHVVRLVAAQVISVTCFLAFPLRFTFDRPATGGLFGALFDVLADFDKPFNQAPSLHIGLLVILWVRYATIVPRAWHWALNAWAILIAMSVLTTYQHHFIDLPTGLWTGALCLWLFPDEPALRPRWQPLASDPARRRLALRYALGAVGIGALSLALGGAALWLAWAAAALALVAANYAWIGPAGFQKGTDGRMTVGAVLLFAPYLAGAWVNSRVWTRGRPKANEVAPGVWLGRFPGPADLTTLGLKSWVDTTAELPAQASAVAYRLAPLLDLVPPTVAELERAVESVAALAVARPTLVACALGYSRSALVVAAWTLATGGASDPDAAIALVERVRPGIVLPGAHRALLREWHAGRANGVRR